MIAIDLGSNTLRVLQVDCVSLKRVFEFEKITKLAQGVRVDGNISDEHIETVINTLQEISKTVSFKSEKIIAYATAALRDAKNGKEVVKRIYDATAISFEIIDGESEAKLTLKAVKNRLNELKIATENFWLFDLGGGSTELIHHSEHREVFKSFPIGIIGLSEKIDINLDVKAQVEPYLEPIKNFAKEFSRPEVLIATAGTPTTVAAYTLGMTYANYDSKRVNGTKIDLSTLNGALGTLLKLDELERSRYVGVGREEFIAVGIIMIKEIFSILRFSEAVVIDDGLREGIALMGCEES